MFVEDENGGEGWGREEQGREERQKQAQLKSAHGFLGRMFKLRGMVQGRSQPG